MEKALTAMGKDLNAIRTGRASPDLLASVHIDYYGVSTPLNQIASISAPDPKLLVIQPWDKTTLASIEKGLFKSDLGLTPTNDGNVIRLSIPPLTEDRRKDLVKMVRKRAEECKVTLRNLRRDALDKMRTMEKNKEISQDDLQRATGRLQKVTDSFTAQTDQIGQAKETEIMEF